MRNSIPASALAAVRANLAEATNVVVKQIATTARIVSGSQAFTPYNWLWTNMASTIPDGSPMDKPMALSSAARRHTSHPIRKGGPPRAERTANSRFRLATE